MSRLVFLNCSENKVAVYLSSGTSLQPSLEASNPLSFQLLLLSHDYMNPQLTVHEVVLNETAITEYQYLRDCFPMPNYFLISEEHQPLIHL